MMPGAGSYYAQRKNPGNPGFEMSVMMTGAHEYK